MNQIQYISLYFLVASRAKLNMLNTVSKIRGQVKTTGYPQPEGLLGDCMLRYGHELGDHSAFGTNSFRHSASLSALYNVVPAQMVPANMNCCRMQC